MFLTVALMQPVLDVDFFLKSMIGHLLESQLKVKPCVGCGYCCRKAICVLGMKIADLEGKPTDNGCPYLYLEGIYRCELAKNEAYCKELFIGEGCCCSLNTDRLKVKNGRIYG